MYLAKMAANATALDPSGGVPAPLQRLERFVFVLTGEVTVKAAKHEAVVLGANQFAYLPRDMSHVIMSETGAELMVFERKHRGADVRGAGKAAAPVFLHGDVEAQPVLPVGGEVFVLRKLLPQTVDYDFNVHVMDFMPGEYLNVKEVHYNQHGKCSLAGPHSAPHSAHVWSCSLGDMLTLSLRVALSQVCCCCRARGCTDWGTTGCRYRQVTPSGWRPTCRSGTPPWEPRPRDIFCTKTLPWTRWTSDAGKK